MLRLSLIALFTACLATLGFAASSVPVPPPEHTVQVASLPTS